jgi:hypothetical protein
MPAPGWTGLRFMVNLFHDEESETNDRRLINLV